MCVRSPSRCTSSMKTINTRIPPALLAVFLLLNACDSREEALRLFAQGKEAYEKKDLARAKGLFTKALEDDKCLHNARLMLSKICYYERDFVGALEHQNEIIDDEPNHVGALYWKAKTLVVQPARGKKNEEEAVACLTRVLELDGHHLPARSLLALLHEKNERYKEALEEYREILLEEEALVSARANLSVLYRRLGLKERALGEIDAAIAVARGAGLPDSNLNLIKKEIEQ